MFCDEFAVDKSFTLLARDSSSGTKASGGAKGVTLKVVGLGFGAHMLRRSLALRPVDIGDKPK
jgi:hypothetical protein